VKSCDCKELTIQGSVDEVKLRQHSPGTNKKSRVYCSSDLEIIEMSDSPSKKKSNVSEYNSPPAHDLNSFLDSDSDCEASGPVKSRKIKSTPVDVDPPTYDESHSSDTASVPAGPPADNLSLDTDVDEAVHLGAETPDESQRAYTPPSYLAKGRSTFSRYSDLKYSMPSQDPVRPLDSLYSDPPAYNMNNFMDSDSECGTPEKPDRKHLPAPVLKVPSKHFSDSEPDIVSSSRQEIEKSSDSSELDDLAILKKANDISEKCRVQGDSNGSVVISRLPVSVFRRVESFDSIPPARHRKVFKKQKAEEELEEEEDENEDDEDEDAEESGDVLSCLGLSSKNFEISNRSLFIDVEKGNTSNCIYDYGISTTVLLIVLAI
jgi:hypothetical protein